uniref:DWNN domain-containing protein n=1 Tax=Meloidogyne hapla TaxID=6305 RepID=A0A1I8C204_MELHA
MSSVHYKFKATLEYKTLTFDGLHIGVDELKKAICDKENIRTESFDLLITNAHTKREYTTGELVPRNSSVVVQRLPRDNALKLPKVQDTTNSGIVQRSAGVFQSSTYISPLSKTTNWYHVWTSSTDLCLQSLCPAWSLVQKLSIGNFSSLLPLFHFDDEEIE